MPLHFVEKNNAKLRHLGIITSGGYIMKTLDEMNVQFLEYIYKFISLFLYIGLFNLFR